ncbi:hypothetical protein BJ508DRAFT_335202 [Ascobolus immersus RN42]|uniref:Uncharacterized protein n=1 Tax=Ascobolus immersus RN42 TaxID=1160509 RepID=A0A3N4HF86_ASCIM|nr:hypothetical protein BJ508DRAFT_335202 [Ascobolus immersus RN42]
MPLPVNQAPILAAYRKLHETVWGKGLKWAFKNGLIQMIDPYCKPLSVERCAPTEVERNALEFQHRLTSDRPSPDARTMPYVLRFRDLELRFPGKAGDSDVLVREGFYQAYREIGMLDGRKKFARPPAVTFTGNRGSGKSSFLKFCLLVRLLEGRPTAFQDAESMVVLFHHEGVQSIWKESDSTELDRDRQVVALCDALPDERLMLGLNIRHNWGIVATSRPDCQIPGYKKYDLCRRPSVVVRLPIPEHDELYILQYVLEIWGRVFTPVEFTTLCTYFSPNLQQLARYANYLSEGHDFENLVSLVTSDLVDEAKRAIVATTKPANRLSVFLQNENLISTFKSPSIVLERAVTVKGKISHICDVASPVMWAVLARAAVERLWERADAPEGVVDARMVTAAPRFINECWYLFAQLHKGCTARDRRVLRLMLKEPAEWHPPFAPDCLTNLALASKDKWEAYEPVMDRKMTGREGSPLEEEKVRMRLEAMGRALMVRSREGFVAEMVRDVVRMKEEIMTMPIEEARRRTAAFDNHRMEFQRSNLEEKRARGWSWMVASPLWDGEDQEPVVQEPVVIKRKHEGPDDAFPSVPRRDLVLRHLPKKVKLGLEPTSKDTEELSQG